MRFENLTADVRAVRQLEQCITAPENILLTGARGTAKRDIKGACTQDIVQGR